MDGKDGREIAGMQMPQRDYYNEATTIRLSDQRFRLHRARHEEEPKSEQKRFGYHRGNTRKRPSKPGGLKQF